MWKESLTIFILNVMDRLNKFCLVLVLLTVAILSSYYIGFDKGVSSAERSIVNDTVTFIDTIPFFLPVAKDSLVVRYETIRIPVPEETPDSCRNETDSVAVNLPVQSKMYEDSTYKAWVSGYNPSLDSIFVYPRTVFMTERERETKPPNRWALSLTAGYGYTPGEGMKPFVGVGISYTLKPIRWK